MNTHFENNTMVVILGGGRGDRLFPLTKMRSKPAVPLAGRYRLIDIPVSNCLHSRLNRIYVLTQFNSASLNQHISRTYHFDSFSNGYVEVLAAEQTSGSQEWFQGTADAVRKIYPHISGQDWDNILILSGDQMYRMNFAALLDEHLRREADVSLCSLPVCESSASSFGLLKVDETSRIVEFSEKPKGDALQHYKIDTTHFGLSSEQAILKPYLASMGIYVFNRKALHSALFDNPFLNDFGKQVIPEAIKKFKVHSYLFNEYWEDIGTIRAFFEANLSLCQRHPPFQLFHPTRPIYTRQRNLGGSTVIDSHISGSIINDGCFIKKSIVKNSVIGLRSILHDDSVVEDSLLMGADYYDPSENSDSIRLGIGKGSRIKGAIIDKNARIGENVVIENQKKLTHYDDPGERYYIRDGIVIVVKNAIIANNTVI